jgi:GDP-fucose transporter C1
LYNNFNACVIFLPFILLSGEINEIVAFPKIFSAYFWFAMSVSGILGFSMSYVTSLQIQVTSPLTHNVSGTAKAYVQTLMGVMYYNEIKTLLWWLSNCLVLIGAGLYSHVRNQEMKAKHKQTPELPVSSKDSGTDEENSDKAALISQNNIDSIRK